MKRIAILFLAVFLLCGCAAEPFEPPEERKIQPGIQSATPEQTDARSPRQTVEEYFARQYSAYIAMECPDFSDLLDGTQRVNQNAVQWLRILLTRRKLIKENKFCYVETQSFPYHIVFIKEEDLNDGRMSFWSTNWTDGADERTLHFEIRGEPGRAYPPMFALNAQHTMRLHKIGGVWKITYQYYPGSVRRLLRPGTLAAPDEKTMLAQLRQEFKSLAYPDIAPMTPRYAAAYNGAFAARYADTFTESENPAFYDIGDWMGNCANFISQCVWHGFGDGNHMADVPGRENMLPDWYAGNGGGTPAWENVNAFWRFATGENGMHVQTLESARQLRIGDVIQIGSSGGEDAEFNHSLLVTDGVTLKLSQNSPDCFVYYSDLANTRKRMLRPLYIRTSA